MTCREKEVNVSLEVIMNCLWIARISSIFEKKKFGTFCNLFCATQFLSTKTTMMSCDYFQTEFTRGFVCSVLRDAVPLACSGLNRSPVMKASSNKMESMQL